jgi:hypothetical protein
MRAGMNQMGLSLDVASALALARTMEDWSL